MIELICLGWLLPRKIRALSRERGEGALRWWLLALITWLVVDVAVIGLGFGAVIVGVLLGLRVSQDATEVFSVLLYLSATGIAILVAEKWVLDKLRSLPEIESQATRKP